MMDKIRLTDRYIVLSRIIVCIGIMVVLFPLIYYREDYIFTIHDYLDSWPSLFEVLRRSDLFFAPDSSMPIMDGMSTCYLYFDFGAYRLLNFCFGPIWGEIANKAIGLIFGFYFAKRLFNIIAEEDCFVWMRCKSREVSSLYSIKWMTTLLAAAYAFTAVYPNWTLSFTFLPLYLEMLYNILEQQDDKIRFSYVVLSITFGFFVYFPTIGIFVFGVYFIAFLIDAIRHKKVKKNFLLYGFLMFWGILITNINVFIYVLRGDATNRTLFLTSLPGDFKSGIATFIRTTGRVGLFGQYHAAPVLDLLIPICMIGYAVLFFQLLKKKELKRIVFPTVIALVIVALCAIYALNEMKILSIVSSILPFLEGFNLGRVVYFNNVLWYVLAITIFLGLDRNKAVDIILFLGLSINIGVVIMSPGTYRDTEKNIFHKDSLAEGNVTFAQFFDTDYFAELKKDIGYNNEGVVSVGYHPAVAMFNGFNTLDGYISTNPLEYHYKFREIIAPSLDKYPELEKYYDTWGGRLYCFVDNLKNVEPEIFLTDESRSLFIDSSAFSNLGGKFVFSKYQLDNADDLGLVLVERKTDIDSSIYRVWVYEAEGSN